MSVDSSKRWERLFAGLGIGLLMVALTFQVIPFIVSLLLWTIPQLAGISSVRTDEWLISPGATFIYQLLAAILAFGAIRLYTIKRKIDFKALLGLRKLQLKDPLYAVGGYLVYVCVFVLFVMFLQAFTQIDVGKEQSLGFDRDAAGLALIMAFIGLVVLPPLIEEFMFRGFLYGTLRSYAYKAGAAAVLTSLVFAALHLNGSTDGALLWIAFFDTFILSLVMCRVREKSGAIWASIGIHALKNGVVFLNLFILGNS